MFGIVTLGAAVVTDAVFTAGVYIGRKTKQLEKAVVPEREHTNTEVHTNAPSVTVREPEKKPVVLNEEAHGYEWLPELPVPDFEPAKMPDVPEVVRVMLKPAELAAERIRNSVHDL